MKEGNKHLLMSFIVGKKQYGSFVVSLPSRDKVYGDLQRTRSLILHALPDMFHFLEDQRIASTTNKLEGLFFQA